MRRSVGRILALVRTRRNRKNSGFFAGSNVRAMIVDDRRASDDVREYLRVEPLAAELEVLDPGRADDPTG